MPGRHRAWCVLKALLTSPLGFSFCWVHQTNSCSFHASSPLGPPAPFCHAIRGRGGRGHARSPPLWHWLAQPRNRCRPGRRGFTVRHDHRHIRFAAILVQQAVVVVLPLTLDAFETRIQEWADIAAAWSNRTRAVAVLGSSGLGWGVNAAVPATVCGRSGYARDESRDLCGGTPDAVGARSIRGKGARSAHISIRDGECGWWWAAMEPIIACKCCRCGVHWYV